jgi:hypothetical protein
LKSDFLDSCECCRVGHLTASVSLRFWERAIPEMGIYCPLTDRLPFPS